MAIKLALEQLERITKLLLVPHSFLMTRDEPRIEFAEVSGSKCEILIIMGTVENHPVPQETVHHFG
jgi:hypothetical protein